MALSRKYIVVGNNRHPVRVEKIQLDWQADASGAIADTSIVLSGYLVQAITYPGATAPTDLYDIVVNHASGVDLAQSQLANQSSTTAKLTRFSTPSLCEGTCTIKISGNIVANAQGTLILYLADRA